MSDLNKIIDELSKLTVVEAADLSKQLEKKWGVNFANVSALSRYHGKKNIPMSRLLTFTEGSKTVKIQCYLHTSQYSNQGWYKPAEKVITLRHPFRN